MTAKKNLAADSFEPREQQPVLPAHRYAGPDEDDLAGRPPEYGPGEVCVICTHYVNGICQEWNWEVDPFFWCNTFKLIDPMQTEFERQEKAEQAGEQGPVETDESEDNSQ